MSTSSWRTIYLKTKWQKCYRRLTKYIPPKAVHRGPNTIDKGFLKLPPEIRNIIYDLVLPTPDDPKLLYIGKSTYLDVVEQYSEDLRNERFRKVYYGLHLTCRQIHYELPSLQLLLNRGAIVLTVNLLYAGEKYVKRKCRSESFRQILENALYLRLGTQLKIKGVDDISRLNYIPTRSHCGLRLPENNWIIASKPAEYGSMALGRLLSHFLTGETLSGKVLQVQPIHREDKIAMDSQKVLNAIACQCEFPDNRIRVLDRIEMLSDDTQLRSLWMNENLETIKNIHVFFRRKMGRSLRCSLRMFPVGPAVFLDGQGWLHGLQQVEVVLGNRPDAYFEDFQGFIANTQKTVGFELWRAHEV
ncbi:hypothetical protein MMC10_009099 [Thelotrema lepadinum]|nr:hypothetical protein [Thelotrema lepadinum]